MADRNAEVVRMAQRALRRASADRTASAGPAPDGQAGLLARVQRYMRATPGERQGMVRARRVAALKPAPSPDPSSMPWSGRKPPTPMLRTLRGDADMRNYYLKERVATVADRVLADQMATARSQRHRNDIYERAFMEEDFAKHLYKVDPQIREMIGKFYGMHGASQEEQVRRLHKFLMSFAPAPQRIDLRATTG